MTQNKMDKHGPLDAPTANGESSKIPKHYEMPPQIVGQIDFVATGDENVTVVRASFETPTGRIEAIGSSRRRAGDPRDGILGINLAVQRALEILSHRIATQNEIAILKMVKAESDAALARERRRDVSRRQADLELWNKRNPELHKKRREAVRASRAARTAAVEPPLFARGGRVTEAPASDFVDAFTHQELIGTEAPKAVGVGVHPDRSLDGLHRFVKGEDD